MATLAASRLLPTPPLPPPMAMMRAPEAAGTGASSSFCPSISSGSTGELLYSDGRRERGRDFGREDQRVQARIGCLLSTLHTFTFEAVEHMVVPETLQPLASQALRASKVSEPW